MELKKKAKPLIEGMNRKFTSHFGFAIENVTFQRIVQYLYTPRDSSSLAVTRILFGLAMLFDIPDERGGAAMNELWGDPRTCRFPLLPGIQPIPMPYMAIVYAAMWLGALGIMLGYKYRLSASTFAACYWYIFLIEKSYWNNHSYLFGLVAFLLIWTDANCYWSIDAYLDARTHTTTVPYWNYFVLKYQFFILYFVAGLKKGTTEWLTGYSLPNLAEHWVFTPFKFLLTESQIDYLIVHWFAFLFDLTVAFWMMWSRTRHVAMLFCATFHLMNTQLFRIGMFPWVCLATMPLFYPFNWPKLVCKQTRESIAKFINSSTITTVVDEHESNEETEKVEEEEVTNCINENITNITEISEEKFNTPATSSTEINDGHPIKRKITVSLIILYMALQAFLPYSHFLTKGYNNWTEGLYGYSWNMMVHSWDASSIVVKAVDNDASKDYYIKPFLWTPNDRWSRHGDMLHQYAQCVKQHVEQTLAEKPGHNGRNISIYVDIWCSLNGRFHQRMFDPTIDLVTAPWSPLKQVEWLIPLLTDATNMRSLLDAIRSDVYAWNNYSDVVFLADLPGYHLENFLNPEMMNVSLVVLSGKVALEINAIINGQSHILNEGESFFIPSGRFHKIINIGAKPAYYMYTYFNKTLMETSETNVDEPKTSQKLRILGDFARRLQNMFKFFKLVVTSLFHLFFRLSMSIVMW